MNDIPAEIEEIASKAVEAAFRVHRTLGPGLLESAYEVCLAHELGKLGCKVDRQVLLPIQYDGVNLDAGYRIDLLVDGSVILELKAVDRLQEIHKAQLLTYLKLSGRQLGFLINFNVPRLKDGIQRIVLT